VDLATESSPTLKPAGAGDTKQRLPLTLFGMPLGMAGLGGAWSAAATAIHAPTWPAEIFYGASDALWLAFVIGYLRGGIRTRGAFGDDLRHPFSGPFASVIPLVAVLLSAHYTAYSFTIFAWTCGAAIVALAVVVAQLIAHWLSGAVDLHAIHPGYYIPAVAGPFIASIGLSVLGQPSLAIAAIGAGLFFWVAMTAIVTVRMLIGERLPDAVRPAMTAFVAGTSTANLAWIVAHPGRVDQAQELMTGVLVLMLLVQGALIGEYRTLTFTGGWWIFTFPLASTTNYAVRWFSAVRPPGWETYAWVALGCTTLFILFVAVRTIETTARARVARQRHRLPPAAPRNEFHPRAK
jgi:tellurite resistance protein